MSTKRKRLIEAVESSPPVGVPTPKKRKGKRSNAEKALIHMAIQKARNVFDVLKQHRGSENHDITEHFIRTPSRRAEPEYYKLVKSPIDMTRIQQKLNTEEYLTFDEFCKDVELLVENSKAYYKEDSEEHRDADSLLSIYKDAKEKADKGLPLLPEEDDDDTDDDEGPASPTRSSTIARSVSSGRNSRASTASVDAVDSMMVDDILCGILELTDATGRLISPPFRVVQSKEEFPLYYEKIKEPIDLKTIAHKGRTSAYKQMQEVEADIRLLCRNAQLFAGKNTEIYKDASTIVDFFKEKRDQVLEKGVHCKRREKVVRVVDGLLAQAASSVGTEGFSEDSEEDEDSEDSDDPKWQLYWTLRNELDDKDKGMTLSDPFLELPSRSCYPDYYDDIKNPMSFFMINKKMKRNAYESLIELVTDCMQVFENACEYNIEGSAYFTAAKKLEQLTIKRARELMPSLDLSLFDKKVPMRVKAPPKPKTPKMVAKLEPLDSSSDEKDTPPPPNKKPKSPRKQRPISTGMAEIASTPGKPGRKSMDELMLRYRQKLLSLWEVIYNYKEGEGESEYWPIGAFLELPSAKEYPDYYEVITIPIDMKMIRQRIENNGYDSSTQVISDMRQMFSNCRRYNEPNSQLSRDAQRLESIVLGAHERMKDAPIESPVFLKKKFGWLKTRLAADKRKSAGLNGNSMTSPSFSLANGYSGMSDDDSSNSSVRSPAPSYTPTPKITAKTPKPKSVNDKKKMEDMLSRLPPEQQRMWRLFNCIKDFRDDDGRKLSVAFLKLPTREEYPSYYEVIKKPMDLQRVQQRLNGQGYGAWSDLVADLGLMLDNACKYNETDSDIYKDAVSLQRVLLEKKRELGAADDSTPRVQVEIRSMLTNIFAAVFSKKDADGRCRSDSFGELPELLKARGIAPEDWPFSFDQIKRNIEKCRYRRLDRFQKDFFDLFERARECSPIDSKLFDDATELQVAFVRERDIQCKATLVSTAFMTLEKDVLEMAETCRKNRLMNGEMVAVERRESTEEIVKQEGEVDLSTITIKGVTYTAPCYVYVSRTEDSSKGLPHIMRVERLFRNDSSELMVRGQWVYRPSETLHLPNRRFIENEVFLTPFQDVVLAERLIGNCLVISLKIFLNNEVQGPVDSKDLFVCESRYLGKPRYFVKLKSWPYLEEEESLQLVPRSRPVSPVRVASEFVKADSEVEDHSSQASSSSSEEDIRLREAVVLDVDRQEVAIRGEAVDADGRSYFIQMRTGGGSRHYALGDCVLVFNPQKPYCDVMRIDKLWRENDGSEWFSGGWFARPSDVTHDPGRMFYKREVFAVNQPDQTRRVDDIQNHCAVMLAKEYVKCRPTEIPECDVFVCENRLTGAPLPKGETSSIFVKPIGLMGMSSGDDDSAQLGEPMHIDNVGPLRKLRYYKNGPSVVESELFLFKTPITMEKEMSPLLKNDVAVPLDPLDMDMLDENDTDGTESVASIKPELNTWLAAQPKLTAKSKSGYILFSAEIRKRIMHENPEAGFGEVSKIVGIEWKKLSDDQKRQYEVRAEYIATERAKQEAIRAEQREKLMPGQLRVYQCRWNTCDSQFDSDNGLMEHIVQHHTSQIIMDSDNQYVCMWVTCLRNRKDGKPFPSGPRLHRHMREKHLTTAVRNMYQNQLGRNFFKCISTQTSNGENIQLLHCPYGRGAAGAVNGNQQPSTPQQPGAGGAMSNGHHPHHAHTNGGGGEQHYASPAPNMMHAHPATPQSMYVNGPPSSSHFNQQHPGHAMHPQSSAAPHLHHQQQMTSSGAGDPGRTLVKMPPGAEPVFVHAPSSFMSRRVLHSDTYLRYIESLGSNRQRSVSNWDRSLAASSKNTQPHPKKQVPGHWIRQVAGRDVAPEDDVIKALWRMRDQILESSLGIASEREFAGPL